MKPSYIDCEDCGKEAIRVVAKKRKGRCYDCWMNYQQERIEKKHPYFTLRSEVDLLSAAYQSVPWLYRTLGISLPSIFVRRELRNAFRDFKNKLKPRERVWPFHFNQCSLAMRKGFLVVKNGKPIRAWVTELS